MHGARRRYRTRTSSHLPNSSGLSEPAQATNTHDRTNDPAEKVFQVAEGFEHEDVPSSVELR